MSLRTGFFLVVVCCSCSIPFQFRSDGAIAPGAEGDYEIGFVEFTERGNLIDRENFAGIVEELESRKDSLVLLFVHGWKHNARDEDPNVASFERLLANLARSRQAYGNRKVLGIYVGWPGRSTSVPVVEEMTYWSRKAVAEEVGDGGATEVLLRFERALSGSLVSEDGSRVEKDNIFLIVGHSFGGAVVLSAINDILMERVVNAEPASGCSRSGQDVCESAPCVKTTGFGSGVVLLNPAIEANRLLPLKELVTERCFPSEQPTLLHVISTEADTATHTYFPIGQWLGMLSWQEEESLLRTYRGNPPVIVSEEDLDTVAVGNSEYFWTGRMTQGQEGWDYCSFAKGHWFECGNERSKGMQTTAPDSLIPTRTYEPLALVYTDADFMKGHNDVFNERVSAYLATVAMESISRTRPEARAKKGTKESPRCFGDRFSFSRCFNSFETIFRERFEDETTRLN